MRRDEYLFEKLERLVNFGVELFINGKPATPEQVARRMATAANLYRPGFKYSKEGNLSELDYVSIA